MKLNRFFAGVLAGAMMIGTAGAVQAAVFYAEFTGVVTTNYGATAYPFGTSNLAGLTYTATFAYDPTLGTRANAPMALPSFYSIIGETPAATPILSSNIRINGQNDAVDFTTHPLRDLEIDGIQNGASNGVFGVNGAVGGPIVFSGTPAYEYLYFGFNAAGSGILPFDLTSSPLTGISGGMSVNHYAPTAGGGYAFAYNIAGSVTGFRIYAAEAPGSGVPAPGALALLGLGLLGFNRLRRRS